MKWLILSVGILITLSFQNCKIAKKKELSLKVAADYQETSSLSTHNPSSPLANDPEFNDPSFKAWALRDDLLVVGRKYPWYTENNNKTVALLGNNQGAILTAYLDIYRALKSRRALERLIQQIELTLSHRDDIRGWTNERGESSPVWSTLHKSYFEDSNSEQKSFGFLIETASLTHPIIDFVYLVRVEHPELANWTAFDSRTYGAIADQYLKRVLETYSYIQREMRTETKLTSKIAWLSVPNVDGLKGLKPGRPLPLNYLTEWGKVVNMLYAVTLDQSILDVAQAYAQYVIREMNWNSKYDSYTWYYWPRMTYYEHGYVFGHDNFEDLNHASVTAEYIVSCYQHVGVFYDIDLARVARGIKYHLMSPSGRPLKSFYDTQIEFENDRLGILGRFLPIAHWEHHLRETIINALINFAKVEDATMGAEGHLSHARLIRLKVLGH